MSSPDNTPRPTIVVYGASGLVGRRVAEELARARVDVVVAGRRAAALRDVLAGAPVRVAELGDPAALARALAGARVVVNCAGPLRETAAPVLVAALAAGAHYVDVGGEQAVLHAIYERHESTARRAGLVALPGAGLDCLVGDLAAAWAARHVLGDERDRGGAAVRGEPAPRLGEDHALDEITTSYVFDDLALSAGSQRAWFGAVGTRPLVWLRDRWEPGRAGDHHRVNAGAALGGERDAFAYASGDAITIPRHLAAGRIATYASTTRRAPGVMRLLTTALSLAPRAAGELLAPYADPDTDYGRARFAVVVQVRRGFSAAQIVVRGHDVYRTTARACAWAAERLAARGAGPSGMRAPGELFRAEPALRELARAAELVIEPSFGA